MEFQKTLVTPEVARGYLSKNNINTKVLKWDSSVEKFPKIS